MKASVDGCGVESGKVRDGRVISPIPRSLRKQARLVVLTLAVLWSGASHAEPFIPGNDTEVLERLQAADASTPRELRRLRAEFAADPDKLQHAVDLAKHYVEMARAEGDPRYYGYVQATLRPWWFRAQPPPEVLLMRAGLRQNRHDFDAALDDLAHLLQQQPRHAQAWLMQAVIHTVRGEYRQAIRSCLPLKLLSSDLVAATCVASAASLSGRAEASHGLLDRALQSEPSANPQVRLWALGMQAEISRRLGRNREAERYYRQAMAMEIEDFHLSVAFADFLLDQGRPQEVLVLLKEESLPDALLLRVALAAQRLRSPDSAGHRQNLRARFANARRRDDNRHLREEAYYTLHILHQPGEALPIAQENWSVQREPADARLVLEAALAASDVDAAREVLTWLEQVKLEDVQLTKLRDQLERRQP